MGSLAKETLKSLCCANGWSYGAFWSFDQRNPMLLTMEDSYHEEQMGEIAANMLQKVHILGEGIVGQVASSRTHKWIFSDANVGGCIPSSSTKYRDDSEVHRQFCSGIETIAVISVESQGVVQFGSTQKILEQSEFLNQTKKLFKELENVNGLSSAANQASPVSCESNDLNEWFASFCNGSITPVHAGSCNELMELVYRPIDMRMANVPKEKATPLRLDSSHFTTQLQRASVEALSVLDSELGTQFQQPFSQSASSMDISSAKEPCISTLSSGSSIMTLSESQWSSARAVQDSFLTKQNSTSYCGNIEQILGGDSFPSAFQDGVVSMSKTVDNSGRLMSNQHSSPSICETSDQVLGTETMPGSLEQITMVDFTVDFSNSYFKDNLFGWLPAQENSISAVTNTTGEILSPSVGTFQASSSLAADVLLDVPLKQPANSAQSSITDSYGCGGVQSSVVLGSAEKDHFEGLRQETMCGHHGNSWEEILMPVKNEGCSDDITSVSKCMSDLDDGSAVGPRKALFSELGLGELLGGFSNFNCLPKFEDQLSPSKRRRMETTSSSVSSNRTHIASASCYGASTSIQPLHHLYESKNLLSYLPKPKVNLWIDNSYKMNAGSAVLAKPKKIEEPKKATKKRARPGEGTRPRPKDRQMILDCLAELKKIIPGGEKFTTDGLLDRTIKHMLFLQSVIKYAEKLKQLDELKLLGHQKGTCPRENIRNGSGVTWALEVESQSMICPIIVEDLDQPGLMLIQMLCEDRGFFLEIADVIRDFGLNILRGVTEFQEDKIWARFIVEAKTNITRREVIYFLVKLLERNVTSRTGVKNEPCDVVDGNIPSLNNYQQPAFHCPVSLTETLH